MITHKGSPYVNGKHFIYENELVTYTGKMYKDFFTFIKESDGCEILLTEKETNNLKYYYLKEHSLLQEQENKDDLYQIVASYTDVQLNLINTLGYKKLFSKLRDSFKEELDKLEENGVTYKTHPNKFDNINDIGYIQEMLLDYLQSIQRNISDVSLPNHCAQLTNFIYNIDRMDGDK